MSRKRREVHEEAESSERWLLTYADLITLLLGLFVILYSMSKIDQGKYSEVAIALRNTFGGETLSPGDAGITPMPGSPPGDTGGNGAGGTSDKEQEELMEQVKQTLNQYIDSSKMSVSESSEGLTLHLMEVLLFEIGRADIKPEAKLVLNKVADLIRDLPNEIAIEGHTDDIPIATVQFPSNWHLSIARALNTAYYLIQNGIDPQKISIVGYSEYKPVGSNDIPENRAKNRRVDIVIKKLQEAKGLKIP